MGRAPDWQAAEERPVVVLGAGGMLATAVVDALEERGQHYIALSERDLDITVEGRVAGLLKGFRPRAVINAAAFTDVDGAESNREQAYAVNALGAGNVARVARGIGATMIHISTDYVFDGTKDGAYTPDDATNPINLYGAGKLEGERLVQSAAKDHLIVRTSWLFGPAGKNFVTTMLRLGSARDALKVIDDQRGCPTYTRHFAEGILTLFEKGARGIFHLTNDGSCSWFEFAREIFSQRGMDVRVEAIPTEQYPTPAARPRNSVLDSSKANDILGGPLPLWQTALGQFLGEDQKP